MYALMTTSNGLLKLWCPADQDFPKIKVEKTPLYSGSLNAQSQYVFTETR